MFQAAPVLVVFGRYWRKPPAVLGSAPAAVESGRSVPAVFAQTVAPEGASQVTPQSVCAVFEMLLLTRPMPATVR